MGQQFDKLNTALDEALHHFTANKAINKICGNRPVWSVCLLGLRHREGLTQAQLSKILGVSTSSISNMERGKQKIGKERATLLAFIFKTNYEFFV
jgi:DNA-binding XRE family transcriptional regulator